MPGAGRVAHPCVFCKGGPCFSHSRALEGHTFKQKHSTNKKAVCLGPAWVGKIGCAGIDLN